MIMLIIKIIVKIIVKQNNCKNKIIIQNNGNQTII